MDSKEMDIKSKLLKKSMNDDDDDDDDVDELGSLAIL